MFKLPTGLLGITILL